METNFNAEKKQLKAALEEEKEKLSQQGVKLMLMQRRLDAAAFEAVEKEDQHRAHLEQREARIEVRDCCWRSLRQRIRRSRSQKHMAAVTVEEARGHADSFRASAALAQTPAPTLPGSCVRLCLRARTSPRAPRTLHLCRQPVEARRARFTVQARRGGKHAR